MPHASRLRSKRSLDFARDERNLVLVMKIKKQTAERHVLTVIVDNEAGILAKIAGLFTARG